MDELRHTVGRHKAVARRAARPALRLGAGLLALSLAACGKPTATTALDPTAVEQAVSLHYMPGANHSPQQIPVSLGKVLFIKLASPVPVDVQVRGYGISGHVSPGRPTTLVVNAAKPGRFDIVATGVSDPLAQLIVGQR